MLRSYLVFLLLIMTGQSAAQTMTFAVSDSDFQVTNVFSDVDVFNIFVVINAPLAVGVYDNPAIVSVDYQVRGTLASGTPSGFSQFDLMRSMTGDEFYAQGSSLRFEISQAAVLSDGVQAAELVGSDVVFTFNDRFHPALFELRADGTGRLQNSNNIVVASPLQQVEFGEEYINDLLFDPGNTTLLTSDDAPPPVPVETEGGGGGALSGWLLLLLFGLAAQVTIRRSSHPVAIASQSHPR